MLDISWWHLLIFAIAVIVLVPSKDFPKVMRTIGQYMGRMRRMAAEFRAQFDEALKEAEVADLHEAVTKEMTEIEKTASLADTEHSLNESLNSANTTVNLNEVSAGSSTPASAAVSSEAASPAATAPETMNGAAHPLIEPNEPVTVPQTSGSVAERAAAAWKKAAGDDSGA
jgi:sec-independent protein translocase protein TatB